MNLRGLFCELIFLLFNFAKILSFMKKFFLSILSLVALGVVSLKAQSTDLAFVCNEGDEACFFVANSVDDQALADGINKANCTFTKNGKTIKLYGKIQIVNSFPDIKVQIVDSFPDVDVQLVDSFPDSCGKVKIVESFPETKVQIVDSFPDVKVRLVNSAPGVK